MHELKKEEKSQINNLCFYLKNLGNEDQNKPKSNGMKETTLIKAGKK